MREWKMFEDEFVQRYRKLSDKYSLLIRDEKEYLNTQARARLELERMTPAYKDFPVLIQRCKELENIINTDYSRLEYKNECFKELNEMSKQLDDKYVYIPRVNKYIERSEYLKEYYKLFKKGLSKIYLDVQIKLITDVLSGRKLYPYEDFTDSDLVKLKIYYEIKLQELEASKSWWERLCNINNR